jgi:hypothetical protein
MVLEFGIIAATAIDRGFEVLPGRGGSGIYFHLPQPVRMIDRTMTTNEAASKSS